MKDIREQISALIELQAVDGRIYKLEREKAAKPEEIARLKESYKQKAEEVKEAEALWKDLQMRRKEKEVDLEAKEENVKKYQAQLYQIKTNKEYTALQTEIEGLKADNSLLEEEIIKFLDEIDKAKDALVKKKEMLAAEETRLKEEEMRVQREIETLTGEIGVLDKQREVLTPRLEPPVLARYEKILKNKSGLAMVPVVNEACGGCRMKLPPQVINEIKMNQHIINCEVCARILYVEE